MMSESKTQKIIANAEEFKSGLTWRSLIACLYMVFVFSPAIIWFNLVTVGVTIGGTVSLCTLLIFVEIARLSGRPLTKQEAVIMFNLAVLASGPAMLYIQLVYREYFVVSDIAASFGLTNNIPSWWAPPKSSGVWDLRTFFSPAWSIPLQVFILSEVLGLLSGLFFGILAREFYIETERLAFPLQKIQVEAIVTLTERKEDRLSVLVVSSIVALIYGVLLYTIPMASRAQGTPIQLLPIPWFDLYLEVEKYFPGASFGVATDLLLVSMGLMLPFNIVISLFIGSFGIYFICNHLFVKYGLTPWATVWTPGMDVSVAWQRSTLYFWAGPVIGMSLAAGLTPLLLRPGLIIKALKSAFKPKLSAERVSGERFSPYLLVFLFVTGCIGLLLLNHFLVPDFPLWSLVLYQVVLPFLIMITSVRILGVTGQTFNPPYLSQINILFSGYGKYDAWFLPFRMTPGVWWVSNFKICELTKTTATSWIKAYLISWPLAMVMCFVYVTLFWQMSPIPSAMYPGPAISWPVQATYQALWITRPPGFFDPMLILGFFISTALLTAVFNFAKIPISIVSIAMGSNMPIPSAFTILIGAIVGKVLERILGKIWYGKYRSTLAAGLILGEGVAVVIGTGIALIFRATWIRPY